MKKITEKQLASMSDKEFMELYRIVVLESWSRMVNLVWGKDPRLLFDSVLQSPEQEEAG